MDNVSISDVRYYTRIVEYCGIPCSICNDELVNVAPNTTYSCNISQIQVECLNCGYEGWSS